jgi:hypothetical protein
MWVDVLCIDQVDTEARREIAKMPVYITDAALVLVAAAGRYVDGIFEERTGAESLLKIDCKLNGSDGTVLQAQIHIRRPCQSADELFSDEVFSQAWIFQETVLPKRAIVYGPDQLYWKCHHVAYAEGSASSRAPLLQLGRKYDDDTRETRRVLELWYRIVELYATKQLARRRKKLEALMPVAQQVFTKLGAPYLKGIWGTDICQGLMWYSPLAKQVQTIDGSPNPSWSWASKHGPVSYSLRYGIRATDDEEEAIRWKAALENATHAGGEPTNQFEIDYTKVYPDSAVTLSSVLSTTTSISTQMKDTRLIFDIWELEEKWRGGASFTCAAITRWFSDFSNASARRIGLVLEAINVKDSEVDEANPYVVGRLKQAQTTYARAGAFLGPYLDDDETRWVKETFVVI